jgi:DNA-binding NarL/FixJ family response regulator
MNIAIIENDPDYQKNLKDSIRSYNMVSNDKISCDFFRDSPDFGKVRLRNYHIIISDVSLPTTSGLNVLNSIKDKTAAELVLMSSTQDWMKNDIKDIDDISLIIDKSNIENVMSYIKYIHTKYLMNTFQSNIKKSIDDIMQLTSNLMVKYQ